MSNRPWNFRAETIGPAMACAMHGRWLQRTKFWICSLGWSVIGLSGCATFDQQYERIEISDPSKLNATEARKKALQESSEAMDIPYEQGTLIEADNSVPVEHSTKKPISTSRFNAKKRSDVHLASYQDPAKATKSEPAKTDSVPLSSESIPKGPGVTVPDPDASTGKAGISSPAIEGPSAIPGTSYDSVGVQQITLEQAVYETENSFQLQAAAERMNQAYADYTTASLLPNPTISTIASLQPFPGHPFVVTKQGGPPQYDLGINYPFDWLLFGKRKAAMIAAGCWTQVAEAEYQDVVRQRIALTRAAFFDVLEARELLEVTRQDIQSLKQLEQMTAKQVEQGGAGSVELDRVKLAMLNTERDLRMREGTIKHLKSQLRMLMGRTEMDPDFEVSGSLEIPEPLPPPASADLILTAQQWRPDILSARKQVDWALEAVHSEEQKAKPQFNGSFGLTYQLQEKAIGFPNASSYGGGVSFSLPIFDKNQGHISKAQSVFSQAQHTLQARLSGLQAEVDQAAHAYGAAYRAINLNEEQLKAARNVRDKMRATYGVGGISLLEVLDTERAFRDTSRVLINGRASYWKSLYQLNSVAGTPVGQ